MRNYFIRVILLPLSIFISFLAQSQTPTIGLLYHDSNVSDGYTLFTPQRNHSVYLINDCGEKINEWVFSGLPGATCYLLENGTLLRAVKDSLEIRDWNSNLIWSYSMNANGLKQHHDIEPLPNGNIVCIITDRYTDDEIIAEGRDPSITDNVFKLDKIVELQPVGTNDASIVWEWKFIDHLIQDFDNTKDNFGIVENHPELIDINFDNGYINDWTHVNAIDYNAELDQIIITPRHLSEIFIIDHSTTTAEAAGHTGGNSNRGGDFLWRWGNPQVYRQGGNSNQLLFEPHDGKWVESGYADEGKITVFNNGGDGTNTFSSVHLITPVIEDEIYLMEDEKFLPAEFEWTWSGSILDNTVFEPNKSGTHSLPNGNLIICESSLGQVSEITKDGDHLWTYKNPAGSLIYDQFDEILQQDNSIFRAEKYPTAYIGFSGQDLTPQGIIENENSLSESCIMTIEVENQETNEYSIVNPVVDGNIQFNHIININAVVISDINGKTVLKYDYYNGNNIKVNLKPGIYLLQLYSDKRIVVKKMIIR